MGAATRPPITYLAQPPVAAEANRLGEDHWRELYGDEPYPADLSGVAALQETGAFQYFVAKSGKATVGHAGFFILHSPVHGAKIAIDAFYYVDPAFRTHGTARHLLRFAGETLKAAGAGTVLVSCLHGSPLGPLIERAGYERSATMYRFVGA